MDPRIPWTIKQKVWLLIGGVFTFLVVIMAVVASSLASANLSLPTNSRTTNDSTALVAFGLPAIVLGVTGIALVLTAIRERRTIRWLLRDGMRVEGVIVGVELDRTIHINHRHPWRIRCTAPVPGSDTSMDVFSPEWMTDPTPILPPGTPLPVYLDPAQPDKRHYVDDRDLRKLAR